MLRMMLSVAFLGMLSVVGCGDDDTAPAGGGGSNPSTLGGNSSGGTANGGTANGGAATGGGAGESGNPNAGSGGASVNGGGAGESGNPNAGSGGASENGGGGEAGVSTLPSDEGGAGGVGPGPDCDDVPISNVPSTDCSAATVFSGSFRAKDDAELEPLRGVGTIDGNLYLGDSFAADTHLTHLAALECLNRVTGSVSVEDTELTDMRGLENLTQVDGDFVFDGSPSMDTLAGLERLTKIGGRLQIGTEHYAGIGFTYRSPNLSQLCGLRNLRSLGALLVAETPLQNLAGLEGITELGSLVVYRSWGMRSLHGLEGLRRISGEGLLRGRSKDESAGILLRDDGLQTLNALSNLTELTSVIVGDNVTLVDIRAIANAQGAYSLEVTNNRFLDTCQVQEVASQLDGGGNLTHLKISGNAMCAP